MFDRVVLYCAMLKQACGLKGGGEVTNFQISGKGKIGKIMSEGQSRYHPSCYQWVNSLLHGILIYRFALAD